MQKSKWILILSLSVVLTAAVVLIPGISVTETSGPGLPESETPEAEVQELTDKSQGAPDSEAPAINSSEESAAPEDALPEDILPEEALPAGPSEIRVYQWNGVEIGRYVYTYDEQGNMLTEDNYYMGSEEPRYMKIYTYDEQGRKLTSQSSDSYDRFTLVEYVYDEEGVLTKSLSYSYEKELSYYTLYTDYDEQGNVLRTRNYEPDGNYGDGMRYEYTYDDSGRILTKRETNDQGYIDLLFEYTYDAAGRLLTETRNHSSGIVKYFEYSYDDRGVLRSKKQYDNVSDPGGPLVEDGLFEYVY